MSRLARTYAVLQMVESSGGTSFDSRAQDCTDWTATTATMQGTVRPAASGRLDSTIHNSNCVSLLRVWCVAFAAVSTVTP